MGTPRQSGCARLVGVLALLACLVAPLALAGHHHATLDPARDCGTCVVVHHVPAVGAAPVAFPLPVESRPLTVPALSPAGLAIERSAHPGRAPPVPVGL